MALEVVYKDALILAINKPSGLPVHKGAGKKMETLEDFLDDLRFGLPKKPELAHRLDKDTTGCLILGRNKTALKRLGELFQNHQVQKTYLALVHGVFKSQSGEINLPIEKKLKNKRSWWGKIGRGGQEAITQYEVLSSSEKATLVKLIPVTGRTHQLRIHLQAIGCPIVGDLIYGAQNEKETLCLHCSEMKIPFYAKREKIIIKSNLPKSFKENLALMGIRLHDA